MLKGGSDNIVMINEEWGTLLKIVKLNWDYVKYLKSILTYLLPISVLFDDNAADARCYAGELVWDKEKCSTYRYQLILL